MLTEKSEGSSRRVAVLELPFDAITIETCTNEILATVNAGQGGWVSTVNVAILMMMRRDAELDSYVRESRWVVADGQPIVWLSRLLKRPLPERVSGVDLLEIVCGQAQSVGLPVYLVGGSPATSEVAARNLRGRYPDLLLHYEHGFFEAGKAGEVADRVARSGARIVFVGMGVPRQEYWVNRHLRPAEHDLIAIGVGGTFDVVAGLRSRAPAVLQRLGLEWSYRLLQEPRRLWRRYLLTGVEFLGLAALTLLRARVFNRLNQGIATREDRRETST